MNIRYISLLLALFLPGAPAVAEQLTILPNVSSDRFNVMEYINPPAEHGDAHVCLWEDDKEAAFVYAIDGAWAADHDYWVHITDSLDITATFFVISHTIGTGSWSGWDSVRVLHERGNAVQSHTAYHLNGTASYYTEYKGSKDSIESAIPGNTCYTMGHAGGGIPANDDSCKLYYNGFRRSLEGAKPNRAARTNWAGTNSASTWTADRIETLIDPAVTIWGQSYRYGLGLFHMHNVGTARAANTARLVQLKSYADRIWIPRYQDVSRYGQERDSHTLVVTEVADRLVRFSLADRMNDSVFCYPLTVKVRVNDDWNAAAATQGGEPVDAELKTDAGKKFVLVKAVPDRGEVVLTDGSSSGIVPAGEQAPGTVFRNMDGSMFDVFGNRVDRASALPGVYLCVDGVQVVKRMVLH